MGPIRLLPCPFCGAEAELDQIRQYDNHEYFRDGNWYIRVKHEDNCFLKYTQFIFSGKYHKSTGRYDPPTESVLQQCEAWNRRTFGFIRYPWEDDKKEVTDYES